MNGIVKTFSSKRGYGFIVGENENVYFVHYKSIEGNGFKTLNVNEKVKFSESKTDKGNVALNVVREVKNND